MVLATQPVLCGMKQELQILTAYYNTSEHALTSFFAWDLHAVPLSHLSADSRAGFYTSRHDLPITFISSDTAMIALGRRTSDCMKPTISVIPPLRLSVYPS